MDDALSSDEVSKDGGKTTVTTEQYVDVMAAWRAMHSKSSIAWDALEFMRPPYREWFRPWGLGGPELVNEPEPVWARPTEDELRAYLLKSWDAGAVDVFMAKRAADEAERVARELWEASWRGRIVLGYRRVSREVVQRVGESWRVLRHGVRDEDEY